MLTELFASLDPWDGEGRLDGSGGPGGPTGDTGEPDLSQSVLTARRKRVCPCCHGTGEHPSGFECYRCDSSGSLGGDDPGAGGCNGAGGTSTTAAGHIGEPSYEEDDGYTRRMWDNWHPKLPGTIHRALAVKLPSDHPANDTSRPMHERAHALLGDLSSHLEGRGGLGMHWTSDPAHLKKHLADRLSPGETPVMLHARTPPREHIEDNGWVHEDRAIRDWDTDEREVPVKRNAPLHVTGITWGGNHHDFEEPVAKTAAVHTAVTADDDDGNIHRGLTTVLPPDVHKFVHDEAQPVAARAHMLLAHVRKAKPEINSEEAHGTTGGLGNFWSPIKHKGAEYADQAGWDAYREHEREHGCGGEHSVSGGCPTTNVVIHAGEPHEKHQWTEESRPGERYDRNLSWRLPIRPGAPLHVKGISWREGNDHEPTDYSKSIAERDKRGPYTEHDFPTPVHKQAGWSDNEVPSGVRGRDHQGHEVEMTPQDGWAHLDGSHGEDDGSTVSDHPVTPYAHVHKWLPDKKYWGPNSGHNDQRLFDGEHLRPEVSHDVMARVGSSLKKYRNWAAWTKVYFAGSEAATWEPFNGDFDILIGIDWPVFRKDNPKVQGSDAAIAQQMTDDLWHHTNVKDFYFDLDDGRKVGPFDRTFYVNPVAWDIKALHPYAAYDVSEDTWAVKPLQVPSDWSARSLPESYWTYAEAMAKAVRAIGMLPSEERHRMAANLWEELHTHRSDAFTDGGKGLYDLANVVEKYLDQHPGRLWDKLTQWKNHAPSGPEPWVPTTAKRGFMQTITRKWAEVRHDPGSDDSGADHGGVMVALVPPRDICEALVQEGGEPVESMHVTLAYLGSASQYSKEQLKALPDLVKSWAHGRSPLKPSLGGAGTFTNPNKHVLWAAVDIPHGTVFRDDLVRYLEGHGYEVRHDHGWTPHMTLRYSTTHIRFMPKIDPVSWDEDSLWVCIGGRWESFPIGG